MCSLFSVSGIIYGKDAIFCRNSRNRDNSKSSREGSFKSSSVHGKHSGTGGIRMEALLVTGGKMQTTLFSKG